MLALFSGISPSFQAGREPLFPPPSPSPFIGSTAYRLSAIRRFPFLAAKHSPSCRQRKSSLGFARDDDTRRMRFPHTLSLHDARDIHSLHCHFELSREILLALCSSLPLSRKASNFTLSHIRRYTGVQERSRASLGMTLSEYRSLTLPIYFPCNNDTREAPSTFAALLFFMRRTTPLNPTT